MNISDSERIASVLKSIKYKKTSDMAEANLVVVTMCSVRQSAVDRVHGLAPKFKAIKKTKPNFKTILTGCILKKDRKIFLKSFDYVVDIKDINKIPEILNACKTKGTDNYLNIAPEHSSRFSANVPIMTGCNNFCAYCVVPYARDREISRSAKDIILEIKKLAKRGYKEIWLLGQNVNSYKDKDTNFPKLLKMVNNIPGNFWIRFTSSHPKDFSEELIDAMASCKKVTPYLNLPIQSGDDKVLRLMNRHYTVKDYKNKIKKLREKIPNIGLSTDIIVGFPGETKKQFKNTVKLFKDIKYDMAYINKYSTRAGTMASKLKDNISKEEKKNRENILTQALKQTALEHNKKLLGSKTTVLIDSKNKNNVWSGKNEQYKTVQVETNKNLLGKFIKVKITDAMVWALKGNLTNEK